MQVVKVWLVGLQSEYGLSRKKKFRTFPLYIWWLLAFVSLLPHLSNIPPDRHLHKLSTLMWTLSLNLKAEKKNYSRTDRGQMWLNHLIYITVNSLGEIFIVWKKMIELSEDILAPRVPLSRFCQVLVEWEPTSVTTQWLECSSANCFQLDSWQCLLLSQLPEHVHSIS